MLQQTQVDRVIPIFERFVNAWPDFAALAAASQADVVRAWKGLGYNSRAVRLHKLARAVCDRYAGVLPSAQAELLALPGIGPYTARAIAAFAFDELPFQGHRVDAVAFDFGEELRVIDGGRLAGAHPELAENREQNDCQRDP